jgi:hypothetical protein
MSSQSLLKVLKETEQSLQSQGSSARSALLQRYGVDTSSSTALSQKTLSALLDTLSSKTDAVTATDEAVEISPDVTTASFMSGLKQKLEDMASAPGGSQQAKSMLAALDAGTLVVSDPPAAVMIRAWDSDSVQENNTTGRTGEKIEQTGWSSFLKSHLARGDSGAYSKTAEGSYIDAVTGGSAYFGTVGSAYVYLSWPQANTA